jgi:6-phospho-beta-glucosidase
MIRVAVLGGSSVSTPQFADALAGWADGAQQRVELVLVGRSPDKLKFVASACQRVVATTSEQRSVEVRWSTSVDDALAEANIIVNQVRVGGLQARAFDERFPWKLGLPGEETMGPGGFSNAWRTLPVVRELFERCLAVAPQALIVNLTNPAGMVHQVAERVVRCPKVVTLCASPITLAQTVAAFGGADIGNCRWIYTGMNHFGWLTSLGCDSHDVLGAALQRSSELAVRIGVDAKILDWLGAVPNPYLRYVYHPQRQLKTQRAKRRVRAEELASFESEALKVYRAQSSDPRKLVHRRHAVWYEVCIVPLIASVVEGRSIVMPVGTLNRGHLPFLPDDVMIEVTARVGGSQQPQPLAADPMPDDSVAMLVRNSAYERFAVDAIMSQDREAAVRALAVNPLVPSVDIACAGVAAIEDRFGRLGTFSQ